MKRPGKKTVIALIAGSTIIVATYFTIAIANYFDRYHWTFQAPVIIQAPIKIERRKTAILSPLGIIQKAEAQEIQNPYNPRSPKGIAWEINKKKFGIEQWEALESLITSESNWNPYSVNNSSGSCGLGQAYPCEKMKCEKWDYACQAEWTTEYIKARYGTPSKAYSFWKSHNPHWY